MAEGTKKEPFMEFLQLIKEELKGEHAAIILDNHGTHQACEREALKLGLHFKFIPRYSCKYNSQESVWAAVKREFSRLMSVETETIDSEKMKQLVWRACRSAEVTPAVIDSNLRAV